MPVKADRKALKKQCDQLFSILIRAKGKCERCGKTENLQCAHIISRIYSGTRHDPMNGLCLCAGCHLWWHKEPILATRWLEEKWPGRFDALNIKRLVISKMDYNLVKMDLKGEMQLFQDLDSD